MLRELPSEGEALERAVAAHEPPEGVLISDDERVDRVAHAFAEVIDAKSPATAGHSHRVASLVAGAAESGIVLALALVAVVLAAINMVGGFVVTDRMLVMFRPKKLEQRRPEELER